MTTSIGGSYPSVNTDSDATINGLTVGKGGGAGYDNTAVGYNALTTNSTGIHNTAFGYNALTTNSTGQYNTAIGQAALQSATVGNNTAVGQASAYSTTTGTYITAIGTQTMLNNTTGSNSVAVGYQALYSNTTASNNTAVGFQAGYSNTAGQNSTYIGYQAGYTNNNDGNAFFGRIAGYLSTGNLNAFVGYGAGQSMTTGSKNTILGSYSGNAGGLDIRTASNRIVLSDGDGNPRVFSNGIGNICIGGTTGGNSFFGTEQLNVTQSASDWTIYGYNAYVGTYYGVRINTASAQNNTSSLLYDGLDGGTLRFRVYSNGGIANYQANNSNLSDIREKKDIQLAGNYLDKICAIPVKTFLFNDQTDTDLNLGVIAQDVQAVAPELITESNWGTEEDPKMRLSIYQTDLQYAMMKAIQELKAENDALKARLDKAGL